MNVRFKKELNKFEDLNVGDTFIWKDCKGVHMKVSNVSMNLHTSYNAVDLMDGCLYIFDSKDEVRKINVELVEV